MQILSAASLDHLIDEVHSYFNTVIKEQIQSVHQHAPHLSDSKKKSQSYLSTLTSYIDELIENFEPAEVF